LEEVFRATLLAKITYASSAAVASFLG